MKFIRAAVHNALPVFVYFTLKSAFLRRSLLKKDIQSEKVALDNYRMENCGDGYHTIVPSPGDEVWGELVSVSSDDLAKLDEWEERYRRVKVTLRDGQRAWAYQIEEEKGCASV